MIESNLVEGAQKEPALNAGKVREREFFIDNLLVRIHFIIVMIGWTGLASWEFEFPFPGSHTSTFQYLEHSSNPTTTGHLTLPWKAPAEPCRGWFLLLPPLLLYAGRRIVCFLLGIARVLY